MIRFIHSSPNQSEGATPAHTPLQLSFWFLLAPPVVQVALVFPLHAHRQGRSTDGRWIFAKIKVQVTKVQP